MKTSEVEFLRSQLQAAHNFIRALKKRSRGWGSLFSEGVYIDCENFFRDNPKPKDSTHVVITKRYLGKLQDCAVERNKLKLQLLKKSK